MGNNNSNNSENKTINNIAILEYSNGERYKGEIHEGSRNGFGTYFYNNGERYEGHWYKNFKNGRGSFFYKNGEVYEGIWYNNKKEGIGTYYYNNGSRYYGEWKNNKKNGRGIIYLDNGDMFIGQFKNNKKSGYAEFVRKNKDITYEEWNDGKLIFQSEKVKTTPGKTYDIDYNQLNTQTFQKFLETKTRQNNETKHLQTKSKYFTLSFAKKMKSKNPDGYYDSLRMLHSTNNLVMEKPDMRNWTVDDVIDIFTKIGFEKYISIIKEKKIDGYKLMNINNLDMVQIFEISDETEIKSFNKSLHVLKNLNTETENLKSLQKNISSLTSNHDNTEKEVDNNFFENISENENEEENLEKEEILNNANNNLIMNKNFDFIDKLNSSTRNLSLSVNLNGLNFFINYEELTLKMKVGEGGFGEVFLGVWHGKKVAVKKLTLRNTKFIDNINKFINEINIISSLRHPNIVLYIGASIEKDNYYMITEYLPKGSLFDYIHRDKGKIPIREQISIAYETAVALRYLHTRNIIHCDLKSSNILIDDNWKIKISDFGLSKFFNSNNSDDNRGRIGTPHWMAPEILKGEKYEHSADIFSFGMILWEILSLEIPYYGINPYQVISLVADQRKIVQVPKNGNSVLRHLIEQCLQYDAQKRPKLDDVVDTLEKLKNVSKVSDKCMEEIYEYLI